ncbi:MAG: hypothetical protein IJK65_07040 [Clostridiales bacterium]|nr:hypothetical protein [Clostridiales bacterium]
MYKRVFCFGQRECLSDQLTGRFPDDQFLFAGKAGKLNIYVTRQDHPGMAYDFTGRKDIDILSEFSSARAGP